MWIFPKINVKLPIKHGTEDDVLENCIGHIERTSFPIGGINTHILLCYFFKFKIS